MPLLPNAYASSLLQRDDAGRVVFSPDDGKDSRYLIPDIATEQRILLRLKRIRLAQLAAWILVLATPIALRAATHSAGVTIPKWLFLLGVIVAVVLIGSVTESAQGKLARDLNPLSKDGAKTSLIEKRVGVVRAILKIIFLFPIYAVSKLVAFARESETLRGKIGVFLLWLPLIVGPIAIWAMAWFLLVSVVAMIFGGKV
jgi:hypothetical protein